MTYSPCTEDRPPPPAVVLCGQLEVGQGHGDAGGDRQENTIHHKQDAVQCVLFTSPQGGKNVVQLHRDGAVNRVNR